MNKMSLLQSFIMTSGIEILACTEDLSPLAQSKAEAGDALAASLLQDHVRHFKGLLTIIKVILFFNAIIVPINNE